MLKECHAGEHEKKVGKKGKKKDFCHIPWYYIYVPLPSIVFPARMQVLHSLSFLLTGPFTVRLEALSFSFCLIEISISLLQNNAMNTHPGFFPSFPVSKHFSLNSVSGKKLHYPTY